MDRSTLTQKAVRVVLVILGATLLPSCAPGSAGRGFAPIPTPAVAGRSVLSDCSYFCFPDLPDIHIVTEVAVVITSPPRITIRPHVIVSRNPLRLDVRVPALHAPPHR